MEKIVALNSGGFDSIVMLHRLRDKYPTTPIYTLFFNYGQFTVTEEYRCAKKWVDKDENSHILTIEVQMPCNVDMSLEEQYIPNRNLIFLSYATSYAEDIGAKEIYMAITNPDKEENDRYFDTSERFIMMYNTLIEPLGIKVLTPLSELTKEELLYDVWKYNINKEDFHSCNVSTNKDGCGECGDCKAIDWIYNTKRYVYPVLHYLDHGLDKELKDWIHDLPIDRAKLIINDKCQFKCTHCYMGAQDKITGIPLTKEEWKIVIDECIDYGIKQFDLFGREVLFDDTFIPILSHIYDRGLRNTSIVTNGVNVEKYLSVLIKYKPFIILSVESLDKTEIRTGTVKDSTFKMLLDNNIQVQASIDLSRVNKNGLIELIDHLYNIGVRDFYVKPITPFGEYAENISESMVLTAKEVFDCMDAMNTLDKFNKYKGIHIAMMLKMYHTKRMMEECKERFDRMMYVYRHYKTGYVANMYLDFEFFCTRYDSIITITPDGRVLGCGSDYAIKNPLMQTSGLRDNSLKEILTKEKDNLYDFFKIYGDKKGCYFFDEKFC